MMLTPETHAPPSLDRVIWTDPERLSGAPCFAGTRVPVQALFDYLEGGDTVDDFMESFPGVTREQIEGALYFGKGRLFSEMGEG
jgi:uncharacterized protein (DUF433 family)